jgi:protein-L-isoaspartate(D-aspartate) O-methyltransferase
VNAERARIWRRRLRTAALAVLLGAAAGTWWAMIDSRRPTPRAGAGGDERENGRAEERRRMVAEQIEARGIRSRAVLEAMASVPRHLFVPEEARHLAYEDGPLPIGHQQTISQPYIVALMTEALGLAAGDRVLEVGTGSGYQAAVLAMLARDVYTIEIVEPLGREAAARLRALGYRNAHVRIGDGYQGWSEHAPYDAIIVTAAPEIVPEPLLAQLKLGGRLVIPVGREAQELWLLRRTQGGIERRMLTAVRFVPMTGKAGQIVH